MKKSHLRMESLQLAERTPMAYAAARLLVDQIYHRGEPDYTPDAAEVDGYIDQTGPEETFYVLTRGGSTLIGAACVPECADGKTACIAEIAIDEPYRGQRLYRRMMEHISMIALLQGKDRLVLWTEDTAIPSHIGFQPAAEGTMEAAPLDIFQDAHRT